MECCVCLEDIYVCKTLCNHYICLSCILLIKKLECPLCRRKLEKIPHGIINIRSRLEKSILLNDLNEFPQLQ